MQILSTLSYRQLHCDIITVSLAGNGNHKVIDQAVNLAKAKHLPAISAFDNGKGRRTANKILNDSAVLNGVNVIQDRPIAKDWNECLNIG